MTGAFDLTTSERVELTRLRATASQAYVRERAAALLKVADGMSTARVAQQGLLRPRKPDTLYAWIDRFIDAGIAGLQMRSGRGRTPAFPPSLRDRCGGPGAAHHRHPHALRVWPAGKSLELDNAAGRLSLAAYHYPERSCWQTMCYDGAWGQRWAAPG